MIPDPELLERYATGRDEAAFADLVRRHVNHVYSTALRLVGGDAHLAEDAAQTVFADLARKASALRKCRALSGWLHTSTRFAAAKLVRSEQRRRQREQATLPMPPTSCEYDSAWDQSRAFLDEAIGELDETDRDALLLRYFEEKPFAELGARFGLSENAARMRVERALDRLRSRLALRGITSTAAALGSALAQFVVGTAPATLQDQIVGRVMAGSAATASTSSMLTMAKLALVAVGVLVAVILGVTLKRSSPSVTANDAPAPNSNSQAGAASPEVVPSRTKATPGRATSAARPVPAVFFVDDQTGGAISNRAIKLKGWEKGFHSLVEKQVLLEDGRCVPPFEPAAGPDFRIYTEAEGYANVHLHWKLGSGEALPESYLVRLVRPALIGGRVVDPSGRPVSGATVGFNTENVAAEGASPEDHCVDYLTVKTGSDGRWRIHCLAPEMVARIFGCASHPDYSPSGPVQASRQPEVVQELTNGTLVLRLGEGIIVRGSVVDTSLNQLSTPPCGSDSSITAAAAKQKPVLMVASASAVARPGTESSPPRQTDSLRLQFISRSPPAFRQCNSPLEREGPCAFASWTGRVKQSGAHNSSWTHFRARRGWYPFLRSSCAGRKTLRDASFGPTLRIRSSRLTRWRQAISATASLFSHPKRNSC